MTTENVGLKQLLGFLPFQSRVQRLENVSTIYDTYFKVALHDQI